MASRLALGDDLFAFPTKGIAGIILSLAAGACVHAEPLPPSFSEMEAQVREMDLPDCLPGYWVATMGAASEAEQARVAKKAEQLIAYYKAQEPEYEREATRLGDSGRSIEAGILKEATKRIRLRIRYLSACYLPPDEDDMTHSPDSLPSAFGVSGISGSMGMSGSTAEMNLVEMFGNGSEFPWPPPAPSSRVRIPKSFETLYNKKTMGEVADVIEAALLEVDYSDLRYFTIETSKIDFSSSSFSYGTLNLQRDAVGLAIVTQLERVSENGKPEPEKFRFLPPDSDEPFSLGRYMLELFFAPEGFYRTIVFVITDEPYTPSAESLSQTQMNSLFSTGRSGLAADERRAPFTDAHFIDALVYEFRKSPEERDVRFVEPVRLTAKQHLTQTHLFFAGE